MVERPMGAVPHFLFPKRIRLMIQRRGRWDGCSRKEAGSGDAESNSKIPATANIEQWICATPQVRKRDEKSKTDKPTHVTVKSKKSTTFNKNMTVEITPRP